MICFWKVNKKIVWRNILKEASKTSDLITEHLHETLFSLVNAGTIRVAKNANFAALVELQSLTDNKNELANLHFSTCTLNAK